MKKALKKMKHLVFLMALMSVVLMGLPAALSADVSIPRKEAGLQSYPVAQSTTIYKGAITCVNTSGYLVAGADTNGYRFAGIAYEQVDNSAGSNGDLNARVFTAGVFKLTATSITQAMVGRLMYVTNDGCVDESASYYICVGRLVEYVSATSGWVDIGQRGLTVDNYPGRIYTYLDDGADELGATDYGELHLDGTPTGHVYGRGSWINIENGCTPAAGKLIVPIEGGVYEGGATMTNARIVLCQLQGILTGSPASLHVFRINTTKTVTAVFAAANPGSLGYAASAGTTSTKCGDIPIADVVGAGVVYARCYDAAG